jgi:hypothetical protein
VSGDLLTLGAVAVLVAGSLIPGRRGSRSAFDLLAVLRQRDERGYRAWLTEYLDNDPADIAEALADSQDTYYLEEYLRDVRGLSVNEEQGLIEIEYDLHQIPRDLIDGLPLELYHGTTSALLPKIQAQGLCPASSQQQRSDKAYSTMAGVYLGTRDVLHYARMAARQHGGEPVILTVRRTLDELAPDPDDEHLGWGTSAHQFITPYVPPSDIVEVNRNVW